MGRAAPRASALRRVISGLGGFDTVRAWTRGAVALGLGAGTGLHDSSTLEGGDGLAAVWSRGPALHSRTRARELMGLSQHELAVGLIADPPSEGDAIEFLYFKMLVEKAGFPSLSTVAGGARQLDRARGFHRATSPHSGFLAWHGAMLPVMAAFDAVVLGPTTVRADSLRDVRARIGAITAAQAGVAMVCAAGDCVRGMPGVTESKDVTRSSLATALMSALEGSHAHRVSNGR